jgi:hypothetical protein
MCSRADDVCQSVAPNQVGAVRRSREDRMTEPKTPRYDLFISYAQADR